MAESAGQRQAGLLPAGKPRAGISHQRLHPCPHDRDLLIQADGFQPGGCVAVSPQKNIFRDAGPQKLRLVAQISNNGAALRRRQGGQLPPAEADAAAVGPLAQKYFTQSGLSAGYGSGDADDLSGPGGEGHFGKGRASAGIGKERPETTSSAGGAAGSSGTAWGGWSRGLTRLQDTWAFCTALNSLAALEVLTASLV